MTPYFFIHTYDRISSTILSLLLNQHSLIDCRSIQKDTLLPRAYHSTMDQFIQAHRITQKTFSGNIQNFFACELQQRLKSENVSSHIRSANIALSPELRTSFLIAGWNNYGFTAEETVSILEQQILTDARDANSLLSRYGFLSIYEKVILLYKEIQAADLANQPDQVVTMSAEDQLFLIALATVMAFDTADISSQAPTYLFERLMTNQREFTEFLHYLTQSDAILTEDLSLQREVKREEVNAIIQELALKPWTSWQSKLLNIFIHFPSTNLNWPYIDETPRDFYESVGCDFATDYKQKVRRPSQSRFFALMREASLIDDKRIYLNEHYLIFNKQRITYEVINLASLEDLAQKDKLLTPTRMLYINEKRMRLLFDLTNETLSFAGESGNKLQSFHRLMEEAGIPGEKVYLMCGSDDIAKQYPAWADKHNIAYRVNMIGMHNDALDRENNPAFLKRSEQLLQHVLDTLQAPCIIQSELSREQALA